MVQSSSHPSRAYAAALSSSFVPRRHASTTAAPASAFMGGYNLPQDQNGVYKKPLFDKILIANR